MVAGFIATKKEEDEVVAGRDFVASDDDNVEDEEVTNVCWLLIRSQEPGT
jgi:hypothetical protein